MSDALSKHRTLVICVGLAVVTFAVFWQVTGYGFVSYDDEDYVTRNLKVKNGLSVDGAIWAFTTGYFSYWHPLTWLSHMLDCQLFGLNAGFHHLTSLIFHVLNGMLLFAVFKRMTGAVWRSAFVAAAFALHPLHVESAAWIAERKDVLSTFFLILTLLAYVRYVEKPGPARYLSVMSAFALGLMAKPMLVTLPFAMLLLDYWPLERDEILKPAGDVDLKRAFRLFVEKAPLFVMAAIVGVVTFIVPRGRGSVPTLEELPLAPRIINALISYVKYLQQLVWPSRLAVFYPRTFERGQFGQAVAAALVLLAIFTVVILLARRRKYLLVGWLWYIGILIPVIGLVQVGDQAMADRYTYVSFIGLFVIIAWGSYDLLSIWRYRKIALAASAAVILSIWSACTYFQQRHWQDSGTLFAHAINVTDNNYVAHSSYAYFLFDQGKMDQAIAHSTKSIEIRPNCVNAYIGLGRALLSIGELDKAVGCFETAVRLKPDLDLAYVNLGVACASQGKFEQAISHFNRAIKLNAECADAYSNLGAEYARRGQIDRAIGYYQQALRINPDLAQVHVNLGEALVQKGLFEQAFGHYSEAIRIKPDFAQARKVQAKLLLMQGRIPQAIEKYNDILQLTGDSPDIHNDLGIALSMNGQNELAVQHLRKAVELAPDSAPAHFILARVLSAAGNKEEAVNHFKEAMRLQPDWIKAMNLFARLFATDRNSSTADRQYALELAQRACQLAERDEPSLLDTLAITCAANGRYAEAIENAEKARQLALAGQDQQLAAQIAARLNLYRASQPYYEN